mmetsp:Transcript_3013/g.5472  ORF Transcript_3013/g.5472 Transcript_3013/m.5472 type:complete len:257 (+) Transcript_3013:770-1540(+)
MQEFVGGDQEVGAVAHVAPHRQTHQHPGHPLLPRFRQELPPLPFTAAAAAFSAASSVGGVVRGFGREEIRVGSASRGEGHAGVGVREVAVARERVGRGRGRGIGGTATATAAAAAAADADAAAAAAAAVPAASAIPSPAEQGTEDGTGPAAKKSKPSAPAAAKPFGSEASSFSFTSPVAAKASAPASAPASSGNADVTESEADKKAMRMARFEARKSAEETAAAQVGSQKRPATNEPLDEEEEGQPAPKKPTGDGE